MIKKCLLSLCAVFITFGLIVSSGSAALVLTGGGLQLIQQGGAIASGNLSSSATRVMSPSLVAYGHLEEEVNDGIFGNANSFLANGTIGGVGFAGMNFGAAPITVSSVAFGRSNTGDYVDRTLGAYTLQYTQVANPDNTLTFTGDAATGCCIARINVNDTLIIH